MPVSIFDMLERVHQLPPLPSSAIRVVALTKDPLTSAKQLELVINQDPSLATGMLRRANSTYYGYPKKISSVQEAIVILGFQTTQELAMAHAIAPLLKANLVGYNVEQEGLWKHSILTAIAAERICQIKNLPFKDIAFTAGLLHDIGKLIISIYVEDVGDHLLKRANETKLPYVSFEENVIGYSHAVVGGLMARNWDLPDILVDAITYHHMPSQSKYHTVLSSIIHVANGLVSVIGIGGGVDSFRNPIQQEPLDLLKLTDKNIERLMTDLQTSLSDSLLFS